MFPRYFKSSSYYIVIDRIILEMQNFFIIFEAVGCLTKIKLDEKLITVYLRDVGD